MRWASKKCDETWASVSFAGKHGQPCEGTRAPGVRTFLLLLRSGVGASTHRFSMQRWLKYGIRTVVSLLQVWRCQNFDPAPAPQPWWRLYCGNTLSGRTWSGRMVKSVKSVLHGGTRHFCCEEDGRDSTATFGVLIPIKFRTAFIVNRLIRNVQLCD